MLWVLIRIVRGDSNEYPQHMFLWRNKKKYPLIITKYPPYLFYCLRKVGGKYYRTFPKYSDTQNICRSHSKIWTVWLYHSVRSPNDADGIANSVDPDQTAPVGAVWSGSALFTQVICPKTKDHYGNTVNMRENARQLPGLLLLCLHLFKPHFDYLSFRLLQSSNKYKKNPTFQTPALYTAKKPKCNNTYKKKNWVSNCISIKM